MQNLQLLNEIQNKYVEHFELAGERSPELMIQILSQMVMKERNEKQFYKILATQKQREKHYENYQ